MTQGETEIPQPDLSFDDLRTVLTVTLHAGQLLLEHGADTHRVEETIHRMGTALGAAWMEVYATPTGIIASATNGEEHRTKTRRVVPGSVDLSRIDAINQLSRRITREDLRCRDVADELERIAQMPRHYGRWTTAAIVAVACGCFSQLFGGGWPEFLAAFAGAALAIIMRQELIRRKIGPLLQITPAAFVATLGTLLVGWLLNTQRYDVIVPSAVLPLVPGVPLITALSDLLASDFVSGVSRAAQALLIATEIAVGVALAMRILSWLGG
jgi:uncharacterized membrane protein YjjP (DUF1212 family)